MSILIATDLHQSVTEQLGSAIASGEIAPGTILLIEQLEMTYGASRSVIREAIRVLASLGMVSAKRRIGISVLPMSEWSLYAPQVIKWRLESPGRISQFRSLMEVRAAVEPMAAYLAATRARFDDASRLMGVGAKMWAAGKKGDGEVFLSLDIQFHKIVLDASGNEMFSALNPVIEEILASRVHAGLHPQFPDSSAIQFHMDVASAIQRDQPDEARAAMAKIVTQALEEMSSMWEHLPNYLPTKE